MVLPPPDPRYLLRGEMGAIHSLCFHLNSNVEHLYAGTQGGKVHIWNLQTNRELGQISVGDDPCLHMQIVKKSNLLVQRKCGAINLYKPADSTWILNRSIDVGHCSFCRFKSLSEDEILVPLRDSKVGSFSWRSLKFERMLDPSGFEDCKKLGEVMAIQVIDLTKQWVLVAYEAGVLILWDTHKANPLSKLEIGSFPTALDFDTSLLRGVVGNTTEDLEIIELSEASVLSRRKKITLKNPGVSFAAIRPDGKIFTIGGKDGLLRIFSLKSTRQLAVLEQHRDTIHDIVYSPSKIMAYDCCQLMAAAGKDSHVSLWDIY